MPAVSVTQVRWEKFHKPIIAYGIMTLNEPAYSKPMVA